MFFSRMSNYSRSVRLRSRFRYAASFLAESWFETQKQVTLHSENDQSWWRQSITNPCLFREALSRCVNHHRRSIKNSEFLIFSWRLNCWEFLYFSWKSFKHKNMSINKHMFLYGLRTNVFLSKCAKWMKVPTLEPRQKDSQEHKLTTIASLTLVLFFFKCEKKCVYKYFCEYVKCNCARVCIIQRAGADSSFSSMSFNFHFGKKEKKHLLSFPHTNNRTYCNNE